MIDHPGGNIFADTGLFKYERYKYVMEGIMGVTIEEYERRMRGKIMAIGLLKRSSTKKYGDIMMSIRGQFTFDIDVYLKTLNTTYELMENYSDNKKRVTNIVTTTETNVAQKSRWERTRIPKERKRQRHRHATCSRGRGCIGF